MRVHMEQFDPIEITDQNTSHILTKAGYRRNNLALSFTPQGIFEQLP